MKEVHSADFCLEHFFRAAQSTGASLNIEPHLLQECRTVRKPREAFCSTAIQAVLHVLRSSVVSRRYDAAIKDNDGTDAVAEAVRSTTNGHRDAHKVFVRFRQCVRHDVPAEANYCVHRPAN